MNNLFDVYAMYDVTPASAKDCKVYDDKGQEYLDLYGGHGVISIGHAHPKYVQNLEHQLQSIGFYSNAVKNPLQEQLAQELAQLSGYSDYRLFLCNSGAEANENAIKLASFHTGKSRVIAFDKAFHGRTSAAVSVTDIPKIRASVNTTNPVTFLPLNQIEPVKEALSQGDVCAVIIEAIQGVGGLDEGSTEFFQSLEQLCQQHKVVLIVDEIQSGYGRSGKFFAHQYHNIKPSLITVAKGMGNGFPMGGVLIAPEFKASHGLLGTTFGGNHLACMAGITVLDVLKEENLLAHVDKMSAYFMAKAKNIPQVKAIKGRGLMLGLEFDFEVAKLREKLIYEHRLFTGGSSNKNLLRILPPLTIQETHIDYFFKALETALETSKL